MVGVQIFQLYGNLLTDEACQPWEKIVKAQTDTIPREDLRGEVHDIGQLSTFFNYTP